MSPISQARTPKLIKMKDLVQGHEDRAGIRAQVCLNPGSVLLGTILLCPLPSWLGRQEMETGGRKTWSGEIDAS